MKQTHSSPQGTSQLLTGERSRPVEMQPERPSLATQEVQAQLLAQLAQRRQQLSLTQAEVAQRIGRTRMTIQRAETDGAGMTLSTFVALALATGMTPQLAPEAPDLPQDPARPANIVHRGLHFNRTKYDLAWRDRQREAALAQAWEVVNDPQPVGLRPLLDTLVPRHTQDQATAVATVVQWLGSDIGFDFLTGTLASAGYQIVDLRPT